ncbi:hypothetical protein HDU91_001670 [Kappamyces sp. JEL0680]|nr:hypothetical protein HDU91_001670 [Kappamyces sp. JEL0680]
MAGAATLLKDLMTRLPETLALRSELKELLDSLVVHSRRPLPLDLDSRQDYYTAEPLGAANVHGDAAVAYSTPNHAHDAELEQSNFATKGSQFPNLYSVHQRVFYPITLYEQDLERLSSFVNLLSGIPFVEGIEIDLFHLVCTRIGSQLFLQRSVLLKRILNGLELPNPLRLTRSIYYLSSLVHDWHLLVQRAAHDSSWMANQSGTAVPSHSHSVHSTRYHTFSQESFLSSFKTDYLPSHITTSESDESSNAWQKDDFIDVGLACNLIFQATVKYIRQDAQVAGLISKCTFFLRLYLESCPVETIAEQSQLAQYILSYFSAILDQVHPASSPYHVDAVELQLVCIAIDTLLELSQLLPDTSILSPLVMTYISQHSPLLVDFILKRLLGSADNSRRLRFAARLFCMTGLSIRESAAERMIEACTGEAQPDVLVDLFPAVFSCRPLAHPDSQENRLCLAVLNRLGTDSVEPDTLVPFLASLQSFFVLDHGEALERIHARCLPLLSREECIYYWIRGLLSRDESLRLLSAAKLKEYLDNIKGIDISNVFVLPSGLYSQIAHAPTAGASISTVMALNLVKSFQSVSGPKLTEALSVLRLGLQDVRTRSSLLGMGITPVLLSLLQEQLRGDNPQLVSHDLLGSLKTLAQFHTASREEIRKRSDLLLGLMEIVGRTDEKTRFECARLFVVLLFKMAPAAPKNLEQRLDVPLCVVDTFHLFGLGGSSLGYHGDDPEGFFDAMWQLLPDVEVAPLHSTLLLTSLEDLRLSKSHTEFDLALSFLSRLGLNRSFAAFFVENGVTEIVSKFFCAIPASEEDALLFASVLQFLTCLPPTSKSMEELLIQGWPILLELMAVNGRPFVSKDLSFQIGEGFVDLICKSSTAFLKRLQSTFDPVLKILPHMEDSSRPVNHLMVLFPFVLLDDFITTATESMVRDLIRTLVRLCNSAAKGISESDYQARKSSYLSLLLLRNIVSLAIKDQKNIWGPHWLVNDQIDWLKEYLNHEEDDFQIAAIGLTSDLIFYDDAYVLICDALPYFIDSSTSIVLNSSEVPEKRKEALLLVGNFFHSLKLRSHLQDQARDRTETQIEWKKSGFHIVECLFPKLDDLLHDNYIPLRLATATLLYNLCCANKYQMKKVMRQHSVFPYLYSASHAEGGGLASLDRFCEKEFQETHREMFEELLCLSIHIVSLLAEGETDTIDYLIADTGLLDFVLFVLQFDFSPRQAAGAAPLICTMLTIIIQGIEVTKRQVLQPVVGTFLVRILSLSLDCIQSSDPSVRSSGYTLLSQLLCWQFSVGKELAVETALVHSASLGVSITRALLQRLTRPGIEPSEAAAVENCLHFLLGAFVLCKDIALSLSVFKHVEKRLNDLVSSPHKPDEHKLHQMNSLISLVSKLCSNYTPAKHACCTSLYLSILATIIESDSPYAKLQPTALHSVRTLLTNCDANSVRVCTSLSSNQFGPSLCDVLIAHLTHPLVAPGTFASLVETFKILVVHKESRSLLIKKGLLSIIMSTFFVSVRNRKTAYITGFLHIFLCFAVARDGQLGLVRLPDFGDTILDLLMYRNREVALLALQLCRLLLTQRENKVFFLTNENFIPVVLSLLNTENREMLSLVTSVLWVFVYGFEKAKVECKKHELEKPLLLLEERLKTVDSQGDELVQTCIANTNAVLHLVA